MRNLITISALGALLLPFVPAELHAQDENLVPNGSFESGDIKRLKNYGQLEEITSDWFAYTDAPLDLFSTDVKSEKVMVPGNAYGYEDPSDGNRYAGFRAHTKSPKLARTYFQVRLAENLAKNQMYCVSFDISLSDLSKYAVNGIGAYFSDRKETQPNLGIVARDPQVKHKTDKVMQLNEGWETLCGTVLGTGTEEYMTIGGFNGTKDMEEEKVKKPKSVMGVQQLQAYYYLDNVSVVPVDAKSQCSCSKSSSTAPDLVYGGPSLPSDMSDSDVLGRSAVYYAFVKRVFTEDGKGTLNRLASILKAHSNWTVDVIGHCDNDEVAEGKINPRFADTGRKRAEQVKRYLVSQGVSEGQLNVVGSENSDPASTKDSELARAKNRRVTFRIK
ncbi:OmpA family protein [Flavobacteriales bacterium]|nr:OmpA family protein [Flavobacteriales bacterium]